MATELTVQGLCDLSPELVPHGSAKAQDDRVVEIAVTVCRRY